ncbi:MAG TPA: class IV adenylate cyclase [Pirellulaceae bacterium]|nr:class IV adenylate cyclase [Pirellulaceae bacterium]
MAENFEAKFDCDDLQEAERRARLLGAQFAGELVQTDTYFRVEQGRLKVRQQHAPEPNAELIAYFREDSPQIRLSRYERTPLPDPQATIATLSRRHGQPYAIVRKRRRLYLIGAARIHADSVEDLGQFVEIEVVRPRSAPSGEARGEMPVVSGADGWAATAEAFAQRIAEGLSLRPEQVRSGSYADLLESKRTCG